MVVDIWDGGVVMVVDIWDGGVVMVVPEIFGCRKLLLTR